MCRPTDGPSPVLSVGERRDEMFGARLCELPSFRSSPRRRSRRARFQRMKLFCLLFTTAAMHLSHSRRGRGGAVMAIGPVQLLVLAAVDQSVLTWDRDMAQIRRRALLGDAPACALLVAARPRLADRSDAGGESRRSEPNTIVADRARVTSTAGITARISASTLGAHWGHEGRHTRKIDREAAKKRLE